MGRKEWVDELTGRLLAATQSGGDVSGAQRLDLSWPTLTTPSEALALVAQHPSRSGGVLPHDLWPRQQLWGIARRDAEVLIRGQFLETNNKPTVTLRRTYHFPQVVALRRSITDIDPSVRVDRVKESLDVTAPASVHRMIATLCLTSTIDDPTGHDAIGRLRQDNREFKLEVVNQPAGAVIKQLAETAGVAYRFDSSANPMLQKLVSFSAQDNSLWEIMQRVAKDLDLELTSDSDGALLIRFSK